MYKINFIDIIVKMKSNLTIFGEAIFVGVFVILFYIIQRIVLKNKNIYIELFITGMIFHIIFEYTGLNAWYSLDYIRHINSNN